MLRAILLILLLATPAWSTTYYISTSGSDSSDGLSSDSPIATFAHSYSLLSAGDTLLIMDGTYTEALNITISGTSGSPITFQAVNRGLAVIQPSSSSSAIQVASTPSDIKSYIVIDGITARGTGEHPAININSQDNSAESEMTHDITVKNCGAFGSGHSTEVHTWSVGRSKDCLIEDCWAYGFGRKSIQLYGSLRITVRRVVVRYDYWLGDKPNDPRIGFAVYNSDDGIYENIIAMDIAPDPEGTTSASKAGFAIEGNVSSTVLNLGSQNNSWYGILSLNNYGSGIYSSGISSGANDYNTLKDYVAYDCTGSVINLQAYTSHNTMTLGTVANSSSASGLSIYNTSADYNSISTNAIFGNASHGINDSSGGTNNTFANNSVTDNGIGDDIEAPYLPTFTYIVQPTMVTGHERGGTMVNRYVDGTLTSTALWPWPNEDLIKSQMCNSADLATVGRVASNGPGWEPAWCASGKSLTRYIWEYAGNSCPDDICNASSGSPLGGNSHCPLGGASSFRIRTE